MTPPRDNPFAAARFAPGVLPWIGEIEPLVDRTCVRGARLQIVGPHGSGKSTLLVHLARRARERGWATRSFRGSRGWRALDLLGLSRSPVVVFADEAEELGAVALGLLRMLATVRGAALVVTAHRDLGLETLCERSVDTPTMHALVRRLLDGREAPPRDLLDELLRRHHGNVREVFFDLYDAVGSMATASARVRW